MYSETLGSLFTSKYPISVPLREPDFHGHSRPHSNQNTFYVMIYEATPKNSPQHNQGLSRAIHLSSIIFTLRPHILGPIKRSFKASTQPKHHKTLKPSVKLSMINPLPHGVYRNSLNPVPTRSHRFVEPLCFLS